MKDTLAVVGTLTLLIMVGFIVMAGVDYIVENGDYPSNIPRQTVSELASEYAKKTLAARDQGNFIYGDKVEVLQGHYKGQVGTIGHRKLHGTELEVGYHRVVLTDGHYSSNIEVAANHIVKIEEVKNEN